MVGEFRGVGRAKGASLQSVAEHVVDCDMRCSQARAGAVGTWRPSNGIREHFLENRVFSWTFEKEEGFLSLKDLLFQKQM